MSAAPKQPVSSTASAPPAGASPRKYWFFEVPSSINTLLRGRTVLVTFAALALLFALITFFVVQADLQPTWWDRTTTHEIQEIPLIPFGAVLVAVSQPGFAPWNWIIGLIVVVFLVWRKLYTEAVFMALAAAGSALAEVIKVFIDRPRPSPDIATVNQVLHSYSFPSGHVTGYVSLMGFMIYLIYALHPRSNPLPPLKWGAIVILSLMILLVGPSRVYMGQHWASDALAGYALGFAYLLAVIELHRAWMRHHPKPAETKAVPKPIPDKART